jgi:hypothetical protein
VNRREFIGFLGGAVLAEPRGLMAHPSPRYLVGGLVPFPLAAPLV